MRGGDDASAPGIISRAVDASLALRSNYEGLSATVDINHPTRRTSMLPPSVGQLPR